VSPPRASSVVRRYWHRQASITACACANAGEPELAEALVAERLKVKDDTARRMFLEEPSLTVFKRPRKGRRAYRTLRIPVGVYERVLSRFLRVT
jgi:hypothetical protein